MTVTPLKAPRGRPPLTERHSGVRKGNRLQISHTITPDLLSRVDCLAEGMGQSRAAIINFAIFRLLEQERST